MRCAMLVLGCGSLALVSDGLVRLLSRTTPLDALSATTAGVGLGFGALGILFAAALGPGPTSIDIGWDALTLHFGDRRSHRIDMSRPRRKLKLYVYPSTLPGGAPRKLPWHVLLGFIPVRNPLTPSAYEHLMSWAEHRGMKIEDRPWAGDGPTPRRTVTMVVRGG